MATLERNPARPIVVDASRLEYVDDVGVALLFDLTRRERAPQAQVEIQALMYAALTLLAITFVVTFALPAALSPPDDVHRMSAGMFTLSYSIALAVPIVSGALWDLTGREWTAFIPIFLCAVALTVLGRT